VRIEEGLPVLVICIQWTEKTNMKSYAFVHGKNGKWRLLSD